MTLSSNSFVALRIAVVEPFHRLRFEVGELFLDLVLGGCVDAVDLASHFLTFLLKSAFGAFLLLRGGAKVGLAFGPQSVAFLLLFLLEVLVDLGGFLLGELLHGERFGLRRGLHAFLFLVRYGEVAAIDHVKLLLRDAFLFQLAVGLLGVVADVGMLLLQRRNGTLTEVHCGSRRCHFRRGQGFRRVLGGSGRWRLSHVGESGGHGVFVALDHLHHVCAHVLGLLVALKVVDVLDAVRDICLERLLQFLLGFVCVGAGCRAAAYGIDLARITLRLPFGGWDDDGFFGLLQLFGGLVVGLLVLSQPLQHAGAFEQHGCTFGDQILRHFTGTHRLERGRGGGPGLGGGFAFSYIVFFASGCGFRLFLLLFFLGEFLRIGYRLRRGTFAQFCLRSFCFGFEPDRFFDRHVRRQFHHVAIAGAVQTLAALARGSRSALRRKLKGRPLQGCYTTRGHACRRSWALCPRGFGVFEGWAGRRGLQSRSRHRHSLPSMVRHAMFVMAVVRRRGQTEPDLRYSRCTAASR